MWGKPKGKQIAKDYALDPHKTVEVIKEGFESKQLKPEDFSIRDLAENLITIKGDSIGHSGVNDLYHPQGGFLMEAGDAIDSTAFSNINGQIVYNALMEGFNHDDFVLSRAVNTVSTRFDGEKIAGIEKLDDKGDDFIVNENMPYPRMGVGEDYIETPSTTKRGLIVPVTKEAIFFDRTGMLIENARGVGEVLGLNKEKRIARIVLGIDNNWKWKGTSYDTYQASSPYINIKASNELLDWTDVEAAELLFSDMTDRNTGEPIMVTPRQMVVTPAKKHTARMVVNATSLTRGDHDATDAKITHSANPLDSYEILVTKIGYLEMVNESVSNPTKRWILGDLQKAFSYMENWPITVQEAPRNSYAEFSQDIVQQFKASERGVIAVREPQYAVQSNG